jgi:hypothetical protein
VDVVVFVNPNVRSGADVTGTVVAASAAGEDAKVVVFLRLSLLVREVLAVTAVVIGYVLVGEHAVVSLVLPFPALTHRLIGTVAVVFLVATVAVDTSDETVVAAPMLLVLVFVDTPFILGVVTCSDPSPPSSPQIVIGHHG